MLTAAAVMTMNYITAREVEVKLKVVGVAVDRNGSFTVDEYAFNGWVEGVCGGNSSTPSGLGESAPDAVMHTQA